MREHGVGPSFLRFETEGRRESGEVVSDSKRIVAWAEAHPTT